MAPSIRANGASLSSMCSIRVRPPRGGGAELRPAMDCPPSWDSSPGIRVAEYPGKAGDGPPPFPLVAESPYLPSSLRVVAGPVCSGGAVLAGFRPGPCRAALGACPPPQAASAPAIRPAAIAPTRRFILDLLAGVAQPRAY